jgi:hypothetical protein
MDIVMRFPRIMFYAKIFPLHQVPKFPVDHLAIENLLDYPFFLALDNFWGWRRWNVSTGDRVGRSRSQFDDIENWVETSHGRGETKSVCTIPDPFINCEGTQVSMG